MKHDTTWLARLCAAVLALGLLAGCGSAGSTDSTGDGAAEADAPASAVPETEAAPRTPAEIDLSAAGTVLLSGDAAEATGSGVQAEGSTVTITSGGTYAFSGTLSDGRILVNAPGESVTIALNGADISCSYGSPIYIYRAGQATIHLVEGTENFLADGESYTFADAWSSAAEEEPNACLYSKADLILEGTGHLSVTANYNNGITSKDSLAIYDLTLDVTAKNHGVNGKDSNTIDGAVLTVSCGGDAIRSTNDTDPALGWIRVSGSTLNLTAGEDGLQAETSAALTGVLCTVVSGGGSGAALGDGASAKGIKAGEDLTIAGGSYAMDCCDDAFHANGNVTVSGGSCTVSTGDDAFHADGDLTIAGDAVIDILCSYEGLEGSNVTISGGDIRVVSSDDGVNAAGGADGSGFGGRGMGGAFPVTDGSHSLSISGGSLWVQAGGDGLDSNGSLSMSGGTVQVFSTGNGDCALDYDGSFTLEGGTLLACDSGTMTTTPTAAAQCTICLHFGATLEAGSYVQLASGGQSFVFRLATPAAALTFSSPELTAGESCTVSCGGTYSGEEADGLCSGGTYSGGTELTTLALSDTVTSYGQGGLWGGQAGGKMQGGMRGQAGTGDPMAPAEGLPSETHGKEGKFPGGQPTDGAPPDIP